VRRKGWLYAWVLRSLVRSSLLWCWLCGTQDTLCPSSVTPCMEAPSRPHQVWRPKDLMPSSWAQQFEHSSPYHDVWMKLAWFIGVILKQILGHGVPRILFSLLPFTPLRFIDTNRVSQVALFATLLLSSSQTLWCLLCFCSGFLCLPSPCPHQSQQETSIVSSTKWDHNRHLYISYIFV
jgi:hypothetical protein